jgi:iron complex outermembrane recepter protein
MKITKFAAVSLAALSFSIATSAAAEEASAETSAEASAAADEAQMQSSRDIVVQAEIGFRNRNEETEPVLVYDEDYFQRFEPLTAGDALKRVPSVTFLSDVLESDGARMRGLDPGYTQILINGETVPGTNADRSFFLDRIPAELIEQVEILRSSSARRTGDAMAGTLNIKLRDGFTMDGGYVRGGALFYDDGKVKPTGGLYYGGPLGPGRILFGANVQGRYNPKEKQSFRFGDSPENSEFSEQDDFDNREDQTDTRNGTDYATNAAWSFDNGVTKFELSGNYVRTDRTETERSFEYNDPTAISGSVNGTPPGNLLTDNENVNDIDQENYSIAAKASHEWSLGTSSFKAAYGRFDDDQNETEFEINFDDDEPEFAPEFEPEFEGTQILSKISDKELSFQLDHEIPLNPNMNMVFGGFLQNRDRDTSIFSAEQGTVLPASTHSWNQFVDFPSALAGDFEEFEPEDGGLNTIEEDRLDVFALLEGSASNVKYEFGLRWEHTDVNINDETVDPELAETTVKYDFLLPSASVKMDLGDGRITLSGARTVRRPRFDYISPALLEAEYGDNDLRGNPRLLPESAWGVDLGYEHRIGGMGVVGVNVFYRDVSDLIELTTMLDASGNPIPGSEQDEDEENIEAFVLQPRNVGSGKVWGIEFDMSASLSFVGLPDTGVFGNLSLLDSEVEDFMGKRRFNGQSKYVYNFGFIQNLRDWGAAFGATYRKQGEAFSRTVAEEVTTTYGADLEIFVEKRFGESFTIRAVGSNLLNGKKKEVFNKFDTIQDQIDRNFDEYELESEEAGPVFQVIARYAF